LSTKISKNGPSSWQPVTRAHSSRLNPNPVKHGQIKKQLAQSTFFSQSQSKMPKFSGFLTNPNPKLNTIKAAGQHQGRGFRIKNGPTTNTKTTANSPTKNQFTYHTFSNKHNRPSHTKPTPQINLSHNRTDKNGTTHTTTIARRTQTEPVTPLSFNYLFKSSLGDYIIFI